MAPPLSEFLPASFAALFVTVNPVKSAAIFAILTEDGDPTYRRFTAIKSVAVATGLLVVFALVGDDLLRFVGGMLLTLGALLAAGTIRRWLGETGMSVVTRVLGILLTAVSAEMILQGLKDSGVFLR